MSREDIDCDSNERSSESDKNSYSVEMVDTIFADTLSRGMQNAIVSQHNAQMASSSSVTNACARILQAKSNKMIPLPANNAESAELFDEGSDTTPKAKKKVCSRYKRAQRKVKRAYVATAMVTLSSLVSLIWYIANYFPISHP